MNHNDDQIYFMKICCWWLQKTIRGKNLFLVDKKILISLVCGTAHFIIMKMDHSVICMEYQIRPFDFSKMIKAIVLRWP
jgi:hypothetical protein